MNNKAGATVLQCTELQEENIQLKSQLAAATAASAAEAGKKEAETVDAEKTLQNQGQLMKQQTTKGEFVML